MVELELTWWRLSRIVWAVLWRTLGFLFLFAGAIEGIAALIIVLSGHREWGQLQWVYNWVAAVAWIAATLMALRLALRAKYKEFRIVLAAQKDAASK